MVGLFFVFQKVDCGGAVRAREKGIRVVVFPNTTGEPDGLSTSDLVTALRYSGSTIHFVDDHYDTSRILAQRDVPVLPTDTAEELAARVLKEEHRLYVEVTAALCEERIVWRDDGVLLIRSKENLNEYS
ncbi:hypothetical protein CRG98_043164 [Punica granatum]|uniref:phosphoribosylglycinamide formyltransferase 1 n=1 Tax=Punica granatum TaxID=22663 RepID=A0A2I0HXL8_PUNGR|nr:hypothetical protein CRG98_043164 [Punica granatum]